MTMRDWIEVVRSMRRTDVVSSQQHLLWGAEWLLRAQEAGAGGYAHSYSLVRGWMPGYLETTGYIIPTLLKVADRTGDERYRKSACRAGEWLLAQQNPDGSFAALSGRTYVFDTGQVLEGLVALFHSTGSIAYADAAEQAASWIAALQEEDGRWERHAWNEWAHSYYIKVAAALLKLDAIRPNARWQDVARKNIAWTLSCQNESGWFDRAAFAPGEIPMLHTIVYVLEGLLDCHELIGDEAVRTAARRLGKALLEVDRRDFLLYARYGESGQRMDGQRCIPGMAQWAACAFRMARMESDARYAERAIKHLYYLKARQVRAPGSVLDGAHPASVPFWGRYVRWSFVNWGSKYFLDALLEDGRQTASENDIGGEQEIYVAEAFRSARHYDPGRTLDPRFATPHAWSSVCISTAECARSFPGEKLRIVDVGAARGAWVKAFRDEFPDATVDGFDPCYEAPGLVSRGAVSRLPVPDQSIHVLFLKEVVQHVDDLPRVLEEIRRVLKPGGFLLIIDRNTRSLAGMLKGARELRGAWMYPWDSAFRERWYPLSEWRVMLSGMGDIVRVESIALSPGFPIENRFHLFTVRAR